MRPAPDTRFLIRQFARQGRLQPCALHGWYSVQRVARKNTPYHSPAFGLSSDDWLSAKDSKIKNKMKNYFRILPGAAAGLLLVFTSAAQDPPRPASPAEPLRERLTDRRSVRFGPFEKASKVIGMEVKN